MDTISTCYEEWKSLYSQDLEKVWNTESKELRNFAVIFHTLKQEFLRVESKLNSDLHVLRHKAQKVNNLKAHSSSENIDVSIVRDSTSDRSEELSPKLNKNRKSIMLKKCTPPLLDISNEIKNVENALPVLHLNRQTGSEELFGVTSDSPCINIRKNAPSTIFKSPSDLKSDNNVVESSFLVTNTPELFSAKKLKKHKSRKHLKISQMLDFQQSKGTNMSKTDKESFKESTKNESHDETFFKPNVNKLSSKVIHKSTSTNSSVNTPNKLVIPETFFKDYDKLPAIKVSEPEHPCKGEPVRRKADRLKLPGWSCSDCEKYYKALNLPTEELKKKMNACSKHRAKFQPLDTTPKGFWDMDMSSSSPEIVENMEADYDSTFFLA